MIGNLSQTFSWTFYVAYPFQVPASLFLLYLKINSSKMQQLEIATIWWYAHDIYDSKIFLAESV